MDMVRKHFAAAAAAVAALVCALPAHGAHNWQKVDLREIKVRGEIGRRVDLAIYGNLLKMEIDKPCLDHFRQKKLSGDSVGTGKLVEYAVRFAAYTRDPKVLALKRHVVDELLKTQDADGYIGCLCKEARLWGYWDLAETGFIILGLSAVAPRILVEKVLRHRVVRVAPVVPRADKLINVLFGHVAEDQDIFPYF